MTAQFPGLAGIGWSSHKKPTWATLVASHVSGREVRAALYNNPIWNFELTYDALPSAPGYATVGLLNSDLQTLMGFFLSMQGQWNSFNFLDPSDYQIANPHNFGTGDGATTSFQLTRGLGGFQEAIGSVWIPGAPTLIPFPNGIDLYPPMNLLANSVGADSGLSGTGVTFTGAQSDPNGGALATLVTETNANSGHNCRSTATIPAGASVRFTCFLSDAGGEQYVSLTVANGSSHFQATFDIAGGVVTSQGASSLATIAGASITPAGAGFYQCSVLGVVDPTDTSVSAYAVATDNNPSPGVFPTYAGSTGNAFLIAFPQLEVTTSAASAALDLSLPTLGTVNYGGPVITAAGALIDPSAYTITNGLVTFTSAPANGAALLWSGIYQFLCRFDDDSLDFEEFMSNLWAAKSVKLRSLRFS